VLGRTRYDCAGPIPDHTLFSEAFAQLQDRIRRASPEILPGVLARSSLRVLPFALGEFSARNELLLFRAVLEQWCVATKQHPRGTIFSDGTLLSFVSPVEAVDIVAQISSAISVGSVSSAEQALWNAVKFDGQLFLLQEAETDLKVREPQRWPTIPLWGPDTSQDSSYQTVLPFEVRKRWDAFKRRSRRSEFRTWIKWYESFLLREEFPLFAGSFDRRLLPDEAMALNRALVGHSGNFWLSDVEDVNTRIEGMIASALEADHRPSPSPIAKPQEPEAGPGPQYVPKSGKLAEIASPPGPGEREGHGTLHSRLRGAADTLLKDLPHSNHYRDVRDAVAEYLSLLEPDIEAMDVVGVWSVGGALASLSQAYRE
jgi:hypothetical protein